LSADLSDDIAQVLAVLALEGRCRIDRGRAAWLRTFTRRQAARIRTKRSRELPLAAEPAAPATDDLAGAVRTFLELLPQKQRRALELRYLEAVPATQAAFELHLSVNAYRKLCVRARLLLRKRVERFLGMDRGASGTE